MESFSQSQPFHSTRNVALWVTLSLGFVALLDCVSIIANAAELVLVSQYPETVEASLSGENADFTDMPGGWMQAAVGLIGLGLGGFYILGYLTAVVMFLVWMRRSYLNLKPLRAGRTDYSPAWALGCWFVPFVNLARPYGIIKEVWLKSDPNDINLNAENSPFASTLGIVQIATPLFGLWWGFWIISNIFGNISTRLTFGAETLNQQMVSFSVAIITSLLSIVAAVLAIGVVRGITARQEERHRRLLAATQMNPYNYNPPPMPSAFAPPNFP